MILEVYFSGFQRRAHGKISIEGGMSGSPSCQKALEREGQDSLRTSRASQEVELRGGLAGAGVYPLNKTFATEISTIADWDQSS